MRFKAHPTTYAGVNFRSRLEARWAAFFDLCGWRWEYEPLDLEGWVPDFALYKDGKSHIAVFVEVKPLEPRELREAENRPELSKVLCHVSGELENREVLVCGLGPYKNDHDGDSIGVILSREYDGNCIYSHDSAFGETFDGTHRLDFGSAYMSYQGRITDDYDGNMLGMGDESRAEPLWREAGNRTQWRG